jgi:hypothetical protein
LSYKKSVRQKLSCEKKPEKCVRGFVEKFLSTAEKCKLSIACNVQGLLLRWHSMNVSPKRQPNSEPKAEDKNKS